MNRTLVTAGTLISLGYLGAIAWLRWPLTVESLRDMPLNDFGDSLAGVAGPLAILWLILGFLQQGEELRLSTAALRLQADELRAAVEQQKENVRISSEALEWNRTVRRTEALERARENWPRFVPQMSLQANKENEAYQYSASFQLETAQARIIEVASPDFEVSIEYAPPLMEPGSLVVIGIGRKDSPKELPELLRFHLRFKDERGNELRQEVAYHIRPNGTYLPDHSPPVSWAEEEGSNQWP